jgi:hypothetical protein
MATATIVFGRDFHDAPMPTTVSGQSGWWTLPRQWYCRAYDGGSNQLIASPNEDFSGPSYCCVLADDGIHYAFQDLMREKIAGLI